MYLEIFQTASAENGLGVTLTGICDTFSSLIWDVEYFSPGKFEVYVSANADTIALFRRGNIVGRSDDKQHYGIIEGVYLRTDAENGDYLTISGKSKAHDQDRRSGTVRGRYDERRRYRRYGMPPPQRRDRRGDLAGE